MITIAGRGAVLIGHVRTGTARVGQELHAASGVGGSGLRLTPMQAGGPAGLVFRILRLSASPARIAAGKPGA